MMMTEAATAVEWKRWLDSYQFNAEIEGVHCQIDAPYDDTVGYWIHVHRSHPNYPAGFMSVSASGHAEDWDMAKYLAEKWARDIAQWCSGPTSRIERVPMTDAQRESLVTGVTCLPGPGEEAR